MYSRLALVALAAIAIAGCAGDEGSASGSAEEPPMRRTVTITKSGYHPAEATVAVGGTVTWTNRDPDTDHTAETEDPTYRNMTGGESQDFDTHTLTWGEPYTVTFHKPGAYKYLCSFDPRMTGEIQVVVRDAPR